MSEWEKAKLSWDQETLIAVGDGLVAENQKLREENRRFQKLVNVSKKLYPEFGKNTEYFLKLEAIREIIKQYEEENWTWVYHLASEIKEVLGDD